MQTDTHPNNIHVCSHICYNVTRNALMDGERCHLSGAFGLETQ
jgi:hypothetical protein